MAPFTVLHVCMGNICRSPMAERLLARAVRDRATALASAGGGTGPADQLVRSVSAGTGGWHEGEAMNPPASRQVLGRGGAVDGFTARKLRGDFIDEADLVLTATADQYDYVVALRPEAAARTFVLGEFGRLLPTVDAGALPPAGPTLDAVYARGVAIVEAVHARRGSDPALPTDDLDDPWGRGDQTFTRIGDEIEDTTVPFATLLLP
ncbi:arsenate reductase/protein-tyrosine-phosphatase family protein [Jidongwangia harbinensis]|uniref:arsenate reductase/protein-tyrosine-phosphatase family protein n=1 Tax=Jidongwangia harbinensis TaxID=2878561 RepID=UPI001CD936CB|nr:phosphotyrosine protein phosphatase [Jidongwangia harbinensis]MCA2213546.1 phosphotyrosine protein phosphatase [Jidongwangia harbinensis]